MNRSFRDAHLDPSKVRALQQRRSDNGFGFLTNLHLEDGTTVPVYDCAHSVVMWLAEKTDQKNATEIPVVIDKGSRNVERVVGGYYIS